MGPHSSLYYLLRIRSNSLRVIVPFTSTQTVGLRRVAKGKELSGILNFVQNGQCAMARNWKWRYKENCDKMRSGELQHVAEVLKSLLTLNQDKALSFREKKMLERAWQLLVEEIATVRNCSRQAGELLLSKVVTKANLKPVLPN
jgi:CarD family transcriptional regulator